MSRARIPQLGRGMLANPEPPPYFFDDFNGSTLDLSKWTVIDRQGDQVNSEVNANTPANLTVASSKLLITSRFEDVLSGDRDTAPPHNFLSTSTFHYTSGHIQQATPPFTYGTVSCRYKPCGGRGTWPALWMGGDNWQASQPYTANVAGANWPAADWNEIDYAEFYQGHRTVVNCTNHYISPDSLTEEALPYDATTRFMVYRLQWTASSIIWSVDPEDGTGFQTLRSLSSNIPTNPMFLIINQAIGGIGGGTPVSGDYPLTSEVDWVRVTRP